MKSLQRADLSGVLEKIFEKAQEDLEIEKSSRGINENKGIAC